MMLKKDVNIIKKDGYKLIYNDRKLDIDSSDEYIFNAILDGVKDNKKIRSIIMKHEGCNEIVGNLFLAKFIVKYGEFINDDSEGYTITY